MTREKFNEIIDFAIQGEKDAVAFYHDLQSKSRFEAQRVLLQEYEKMEEGHVTILEDIRNKGFSKIKIKEGKDLHISDYLVDVTPSANMDYQDILLMAMKKEEAAYKMYKDLASRYIGTDIETLFQKLATEELDHKFKFEKLYDDEILTEN